MVLFELLKLVRVFLDYLRIEYLWHVLIMPLTNRNGITSLASGEAHLGEAHGGMDSRVPVGQASRWYKWGVHQTRAVRNLEDGREVCLEEEVERLRRSGMSAREIAGKMGVDEGWVESVVSMSADEDSSAEDRG